MLWRESRALLGRPLFMGYVLQVALIYALFFVFVSLAPYVMVTMLGMPADGSACTTCSSPPASSSATCWCRAPADITTWRAR